ncbi:hypothetical protein [Nonomuraea sediminis]|uniref:hypothetical protein n=1 Tax=Nonomuraea sediminis TaxID=2835864 RepID=UPI001BDBE081|nr:hypothetical protein [Nonomuraea sediminis]
MEVRLIGSPAEVRIGITSLKRTYPGTTVRSIRTSNRGLGSVRAYLTVPLDEPDTVQAATDKNEGLPAKPGDPQRRNQLR